MLAKLLKNSFGISFSLVLCLVLLDIALSFTSLPTVMPKEKPLPKLDPGTLKIAVFGESAAYGSFSERSFSQFLTTLLEDHFPSQKFHLEVFARSGHTFHGIQAEIAKRVASQFDILLFYAGNNEFMNYTDKVGSFRKPEFKHIEQFKPIRRRIQYPFIAFLESHSRIYALGVRSYQKLFGLHVTVPSGQKIDFPEFSIERSVPLEEVRSIGEHFEKDMEDIVQIAQRRNTQVIIAHPVGNEQFKPYYSIRSDRTSQKQWNQFLTLYLKGKKAFEERQYRTSIAYLEDAIQIDATPAIAHYYLGHAYQNTGEEAKSRRHLDQMLSEDGIPLRALPSIREAGIRLSRKYPMVHFLDVRSLFNAAYKVGVSEDTLFKDFVHPSLYGHILIARKFLEGISMLPELADAPQVKLPRLVTLDDFQRAFVQEVIRSKITRTEQASMLTSVTMFLWVHCANSPYQAHYLDYALRYIEQIKSLIGETPQTESIALGWKAMVMAVTQPAYLHNEEIIRMLNRGMLLKPDEIFSIVLAHRHSLTGFQILEQRGIYFVREENRFENRNVPTNISRR